jgi:uncharacterized protein
MPEILFFLVVFAAHTAEAVTGFGGTVIAVALGAQLLPLDVLLPVLVPVNLLLSLYIVARHYRAVDFNLLGRRILPFMAVGVAVGLAVFNRVQSQSLKLFFGLFVAVLSALELLKFLRRRQSAPKPLAPWQAAAWLVSGGIIHGIYASGGPLVVYFAGRQIADKKVFRSTLSALWLLTSTVLVVNYTFTGRLTADTLKLSVLLLPALACSLAAGEWLHRRVDARTFRLVIYLLLLTAGVSLVAGSL